jgi:hypothetical protein
MRSEAILPLAPLLVLLLSAAGSAGAAGGRNEADIRSRLQTYAPVRIQLDMSRLGRRDREALAKMVTAVGVMDALYWKQMGRQALEARQAFAAATDPVDVLYREFIRINYGPFDIRDDNGRFVAVGSGGPRPPGAGFYPEDMTRDEFETRLAAHPDLRPGFEKMNTLIRRVDGILVAIPYETMFLDDLTIASRALAEAAALVDNTGLRRYLSLRSEALLSGDYYASDLAWLEVAGNDLDVVIGPIETYDDTLFGFKASYEGAALVKDTKASRSLDVYRQHLEGMAAALPVEPRFRPARTGGGTVLEVLHVVRFAGDFNAGIKTVAASLPSDERVVQRKGAKKQIYTNVLAAKFDAILAPLARLFLPKKSWPLVTREAFVTNVLLHELSHALGPETVDGNASATVRRALKDRYRAIEEAKADVVGIFNMQYLKTREIVTEDEADENYATYLAGIFRSIRFGSAEGYGQGSAVQLNYLIQEGGIEHDPKKGEFTIHPRRFEPAVAKLARELLEIEGTGDYARAGILIQTFATLAPSIQEAIGRTAAVPVDVDLTYPM